MRNLLVTGGAGFIGSNFVHFFSEKFPKDKLVVLDKLTYAGNLENLKALEGTKNYTFVKGDICNATFVESVFKDYAIDTVVNFAAESHVDRSILGPRDFIETNVIGTFNLLEVARKVWDSDFEGKRFLHVSTDEVYGSLGAEGLFTELTPFAPNSPYAASKASSDHLVRAYFHTYGLPVVTTNCSNNYGPFQFPEKLIPLIIVNSLKGKPLPVYGDGLNVRDWLYVIDHCKAIEKVLADGELGETYNIGGNNEWKNIDIVKLVADLVDEICAADSALGDAFPMEGPRRDLITFVTDRPGHDQRYAIDSTKIWTELSWRPEESFESAIRKTIHWYLDNREWWERIISGAYKDYYDLQYSDR
ncbi:MAG: dTDP-glucose 4,6-dehydratase [Thermodesulfobacteriota bacterium]